MQSFQHGFVIEPRFSVGDVLSRTISTLLNKPGLFFGLAAIAALPAAVINSITFSSGFAFISFLLNTLFGLMIQGAIAYGVFITLAGDDPTLGEALSRGFRRVLHLFLIALIFWILLVFFTFASAMLVMALRGVSIFFILLMLVFGAVMVCSWVVTIQACVVEQLGPIASINRSAELTKGYRWPLFGLLVLLFIGAIVFVVIFSMIIASIFPGNFLLLSKAKVAVFFIVSTFSSAFFGTMCSVVYYDLRAVKEGLTIDSLADIFD